MPPVVSANNFVVLHVSKAFVDEKGAVVSAKKAVLFKVAVSDHCVMVAMSFFKRAMSEAI